MANLENLTQAGRHLTTQEAQILGSKGGKASVKARRKRKAMKEQLEMLLMLPLKDEILKENIINFGIDTNEITNQMAIIISLFQEALKGNTKAWELIRDTIGEKPIDKQEIKEITTEWFK